MRNLMKRGIALLLVLLICVSLLPAISFDASAATAYKYNWGKRGVIATSLSQDAEDFYEENNTSYDELSSNSGGTGKSDAPTSDLYYALKDLMVSAHKNQTSYNATKELYRYTDCENGGGKISSFYSGTPIGPGWGEGGSWNREHTWPNSKGLGGNDENDIMMLRPTSTSENSSRGNTAYGKSSGYYNPNSESGGNYDLRGDVARIFLYVYVRWGNTGYAWGTGGVMESVEVLLEWMEADPVDTWELGRNDAVESITGTRNVFVDYPEFAFLLFGEEIPDDMTTPSSEGGKGCGHDNFDTGVTVAATCTEKGYVLFTCKTAGCGYTYKDNVTDAKGHSYTDGICVTCGEAKPDESAKPTYVKEVVPGKAYKLGFYSTYMGADYFFTGTMSTQHQYYGATDTAYTNGVDVYVETANGGYHLYFNNDSGKKQYINLVLSDTHYNFTYGDAATSVFTWDTSKYAFKTTVSGTVCYMGNYGTYVNMATIKESQYDATTNYVARLYTFGDGSSTPGGDVGGNPGGTTPDKPCEHSYSAIVIAPTCTSGGFTIYICSLCDDEYTDNKTAPAGHSYSGDKCTACGAEKSTETKVTISFADKANRTEISDSKQVWKQNGITVTNNKAGASSDVADYANPVRFYQNSDVIIEYPGIIKLEIDCSGLDAKYVGSWTANAPAGATATNNNGIITVEFSFAVNSVTYTNLTKQSRAYSITVYTAGGGNPSSPSCEHDSFKFEGAIDATCTTDGHTGKVVCNDCGEIINEGQRIPATDHSWTAADCDTPKTCSTCKVTDGNALGHNWIESNGTKTCDRCGTSEDVQTPGTNPGGDDTPGGDGNPDGDDTPDNGSPDEKDHSECEASGFKAFLNAIANFFRTLFGGKKKCVCGEFYD